MSTAFVTKRVAGSFMIERNGPKITGKKDAQWLSSGGIWVNSAFDALGFKKRQDAERIIETLNKTK